MPRHLFLAASFLASALTAQTVHFVGAGGHAQIQNAIAVAAHGDIVVIASGTYAPFTLTKDLTLTAAPGATVEIVPATFGTSRIQPPTRANLVGLRFRPIFPILQHLVQVRSGQVTIADCVFQSISAPGWPALDVQNANVALQRCVVLGGPMPPGGVGAFVGGDALVVGNGNLAAVDCTIRGGDLSFDYTTSGGHGIRATNAAVHLVRCNVTGGGNSAIVSLYPAGNGVQVFGASRVSIADSTVRGGDGHATAGNAAIHNLGTAPVVTTRTSLVAGPGNPVGPVTIGSITSGPMLGFGSTTAPITLGSTWRLDYRTSPGTPVITVLSTRLFATSQPLLAELAWLPLDNASIAAIGVTDSLGALPFVVPVPAITSLQHATFYVQGVADLSTPLEVSAPVGGVVR